MTSTYQRLYQDDPQGAPYIYTGCRYGRKFSTIDDRVEEEKCPKIGLFEMVFIGVFNVSGVLPLMLVSNLRKGAERFPYQAIMTEMVWRLAARNTLFSVRH